MVATDRHKLFSVLLTDMYDTPGVQGQEFVHVGRESDVVAVSFPAILGEAGYGSSKGFLYGRIRGGADAELVYGVSEELSLIHI